MFPVFSSSFSHMHANTHSPSHICMYPSPALKGKQCAKRLKCCSFISVSFSVFTDSRTDCEGRQKPQRKAIQSYQCIPSQILSQENARESILCFPFTCYASRFLSHLFNIEAEGAKHCITRTSKKP